MASAHNVVIVDEELVKTYWPNSDPIGKRITFNDFSDSTITWISVVGVVGHTMHEGLDAEKRIQVYFPVAQAGNNFMVYAVRTTAEPMAAVGTVREALKSVDPDVAIANINTMDDLVSTSSIMPQKRNAYVLENIRGRAVAPVGALTHALAGVKNTPFSNSVEAGSESLAPLWGALASLESAVRLTHLLVSHVEVRPERMQAFLDGAATTMTAVADLLVAGHGIAFRTAHDVVGQLVARHADAASLPPAALKETLEALLAEAGLELTLDGARLSEALSPRACVDAALHGGGPAPGPVRAQLERLRGRLSALTDALDARQRQYRSADAELDRAVEAVQGEKA